MLSARDTPLRTVLAAYGTIYSGWLYVLILLCTSSWVLFKVDWNSFFVCAAVSLAFFVGCLATFKFRTSVILRLPLWIPLILVPYFFSIYGPFYWGPAKADSITAGFISSFEETLLRENPQIQDWLYFRPPKPQTCENEKSPFELRLTTNNRLTHVKVPCFPPALLNRERSNILNGQ